MYILLNDIIYICVCVRIIYIYLYLYNYIYVSKKGTDEYGLSTV